MISVVRILAFIALAPNIVAGQVRLMHVGPTNIIISSKSLLLTDAHRRDPFANDGRARSVMVSSFHPIANCSNLGVESYMPASTANFMDKKFGVYGLPNGTFPSLQTEVCKSPPRQTPCAQQDLPLVLFSGALATSRYLYTVLLQSISAHGYRVVSIDHPYDADIVQYPDGTIITGIEISDDRINQTVATRADDIAFVYYSLGKRRVATQLFSGQSLQRHKSGAAILGHSLGGAAAGVAMLQLPSIRGGINLDGTMFGPVLDKGLDRPFFFMGHDNKTQATDPSWKTIWPKLRSWKKEIEVRKSAHYSFSDLPLLLQALGVGGESLPGVEVLLGSIEGRRMMQLTVAYVVAFLDMVLKVESKEAFDTLLKEFPEAVSVA